MPEPVLISIAAALAGKAATSLYVLVKRKFRDSPKSATALEAAQGAATDSAQVRALATELDAAEATDPQFAAELRAMWNTVSARQHAEHGGVVNQISGNVSDRVVQARDIDGGVNF